MFQIVSKARCGARCNRHHGQGGVFFSGGGKAGSIADKYIRRAMNTIPGVGDTVFWLCVHPGRSPIVSGRSREQGGDDRPKSCATTGVFHQVHQVLAGANDILHLGITITNANVKGGKSEFIFLGCRGLRNARLRRNHRPDHLYTHSGSLQTKPAPDPILPPIPATVRPGTTLRADPDPIITAEGPAETTIIWSTTAKHVQIRIDSPSGPPMANGLAGHQSLKVTEPGGPTGTMSQQDCAASTQTIGQSVFGYLPAGFPGVRVFGMTASFDYLFVVKIGTP